MPTLPISLTEIISCRLNVLRSSHHLWKHHHPRTKVWTTRVLKAQSWTLRWSAIHVATHVHCETFVMKSDIVFFPAMDFSIETTISQQKLLVDDIRTQLLLWSVAYTLAIRQDFDVYDDVNYNLFIGFLAHFPNHTETKCWILASGYCNYCGHASNAHHLEFLI